MTRTSVTGTGRHTASHTGRVRVHEREQLVERGIVAVGFDVHLHRDLLKAGPHLQVEIEHALQIDVAGEFGCDRIDADAARDVSSAPAPKNPWIVERFPTPSIH